MLEFEGEREKGMEVKAGLAEEMRGLIADFDPGTPSVSQHSPPQALHFNTPDIRTAKFTWVKNRERCCVLFQRVWLQGYSRSMSQTILCPFVFAMSHPRDSLW